MMKIGLEIIDMQDEVIVKALLDSGAIKLVMSWSLLRSRDLS